MTEAARPARQGLGADVVSVWYPRDLSGPLVLKGVLRRRKGPSYDV